jgi:hypothetical protein
MVEMVLLTSSGIIMGVGGGTERQDEVAAAWWRIRRLRRWHRCGHAHPYHLKDEDLAAQRGALRLRQRWLRHAARHCCSIQPAPPDTLVTAAAAAAAVSDPSDCVDLYFPTSQEEGGWRSLA